MFSRVHRLLMLVFVAGCVRASTAERPSPQPEHVPAAGVEAVPVAPWTFRFAEGAHRLELEGTGVIQAVDSGRIDSVHTTMRVTYRFENDEASVIRGTVESFAITVGQSDSIVSQGLPFEFRVDSLAGEMLGVTDSCSNPAPALSSIARELLPILPPAVVSGSRWSDTVTTIVCRGDIPLRTHTIRDHLVRGLVHVQGVPAALEVVRVSSTEISGSGRGPVQATNVTGTGSSRGVFLLNLGSGHLIEGQLQSTLELLFDAASRRERFRQTTRYTIRPVPEGGAGSQGSK